MGRMKDFYFRGDKFYLTLIAEKDIIFSFELE